MGGRILCFEVTERQPKSAKARKGKLLEVYQRFTKSFGSWRTKLGKWTRMMVVTEGLKSKSHKDHLLIYAWSDHLLHAASHSHHVGHCPCH